MRDAFGGAFMIKIFLIFIIIYVGFTAIALNYAKAFKVKNKIIEYLENNEVTNIGNMPAEEYDKMNDYFENDILGTMNYRVEANCPQNYVYCKNGIVIVESGKSVNTEGIYYKVTTFFGWSIPFINKLLALNNTGSKAETAIGNWKISGETRLIVRE